MKLDKIKFARLIAFINQWTLLNENDIRTIDDMIDIETPVINAYPAAQAINDLMALMALIAQGTNKIEAIKLHRHLTGYGLKQSKDEVEKHWPAKPTQQSDATLGDILKQATVKD